MRFKLSAFIGVAVMALGLVQLATHYSQAQEFSCDAPCGGDSTIWPWIYPPAPFSAMLPVNGCQFNNPPTCCTVTAYYRYRHVCGIPGNFQIEITKLSWDKACAPAFDPVPMIRVITFSLLTQNPMNFPPDLSRPERDSGLCMSNYTVQAATCWKNLPGMKAAENCAVDTAGYACCKGGYEVCWKEGPNGPYRDIQWIGQSTVWNNCVAPCMPSCGAFNEDEIRNRRKGDSPSLSMSPNPFIGNENITSDPVINASSVTKESKSTPHQR